MKSNQSDNKRMPKWLIKTQLGSWEPEIFISGIVLFGLIQIPTYLAEFRLYFSREVFGLGTDMDNLIAVLVTGINWMIFGLVLHLFFRGIWIGLVGLSYVFPEGINNEKLGYKGKFDRVINKIPDVTDQIIKLEKISSSIFSINYLMFMCILGAYFYIVLAILTPVYIFILISDFTLLEAFTAEGSIRKYIDIYAGIMSILGCIYMFDFLSLGLVKRIKYINTVYYPLYRFASTLTFSFLYRNIYYLLISNFKKWKVFAFLVAFVGITIFMIGQSAGNSSLSSSLSQLEFYGKENDHFIYSIHYDNLNTQKNNWASIQSDVIKGNTLRLFIANRVAFKDSVRSVCDTQIKNIDSDSYKLACLDNFYNITINDSLITIDEWFFYKHPITDNRGIITYVNISGLDNGMHKLQVDIENWITDTYSIIPFYLDR